MANHPNRNRGPYTAELFGSSWSIGPRSQFATVRECRRWAEEHGATADSCTIYDASGRAVARHVRDRNGDGLRWFRAEA